MIFKTTNTMDFDSKEAFNNFMDYIFRTGEAKKYENEHTSQNEIYLIDVEEEKLDGYKLNSLKTRETIKNDLFDSLMLLPFKKFKAIRLDCPSEDDFSFNEEMYKEMHLRMTILDDTFKVLFYITQVDNLEKYCHFYAVLYIPKSEEDEE